MGASRGPLRRRSLDRPRRSTADGWVPLAFVAPMLLVFLGFYLWPAIQTVISSFFEWGLLRPWSATDLDTWQFVGLKNYTSVLTDGSFWNAAVNTIVWLVLLPLLVGAFSLGLAIMIWFLGRGAWLYRSVFVLPLTISLAAIGVIWTFVYNTDPDIGILNAILGLVGLEGADLDFGWFSLNLGAWLSDLGHLSLGPIRINLTNLALVLPAFWAFTGFGVITFTAGLTSLPSDLVESARIDGAGPWQTVRHVILPSLRGPMTVVLVQMVIFALRTFDIVYVMTGGGPADDTMVLALLLWLQGFQFLDTPQAGMASAIAVLLSLTMIVGAYPYLRRATRAEER